MRGGPLQIAMSKKARFWPQKPTFSVKSYFLCPKFTEGDQVSKSIWWSDFCIKLTYDLENKIQAGTYEYNLAWKLSAILAQIDPLSAFATKLDRAQ